MATDGNYDHGYDISRFEIVVSQKFHCSICSLVLKDPVMCKNQHYYCSSCIKEYLANSKSCPSCLEDLTVDTLNEAPMIVTDYLSELNIHCDFHKRGCTEIVRVGDLKRHVTNCGYSPVQCSNDGCDVLVNLNEKLCHETEDCDFRAFNCYDFNKLKKELGETKDHILARESLMRDEIKAELRNEIKEMKEEIMDEMNDEIDLMREEVKKEMKEVKIEMKGMKNDIKMEIKVVKSEMKAVKNEMKVTRDVLKSELKNDVKVMTEGIKTEIKNKMVGMSEEMKVEVKGELKKVKQDDTKGEIKKLNSEIKVMKNELKMEMRGMREKIQAIVKQEMNQMKEEIKKEVKEIVSSVIQDVMVDIEGLKSSD